MSTFSAVLLVLLVISVVVCAWLVFERIRIQRLLSSGSERLRKAEQESIEARAIVDERSRAAEGIEARRASETAELRGERDTALSALGQARVELARMTEQLEAQSRAAAEERKYLETRIAEHNDTFARLAGETLDQSNKRFIELASSHFAKLSEKSSTDLEHRQKTIATMVEPISKTLELTRARLDDAEKARAESFARLDEKLKEHAESSRRLHQTTESLSRALSRPEVRGRYGEIQLRRVAELAGMVPYCDFTEQTSTRDHEGNLLRPDMIVTLPNDRVIAVDAKCNIDAYIRAAETGDADQRELLLEKFASDVQNQAKKLSSKSYWAEFSGSPEFVVMFVPGDQFLDAALSRRSGLLDLAAQQNVILASPATLIGLLRAVAVGWREQSLADNAKKLYELGRELHERAATMMGHASDLGTALNRSVDKYNSFVASAETRLLPTLRKFEDAGARGVKDLPEPAHISVTTRHPLLRSGADPDALEPDSD